MTDQELKLHLLQMCSGNTNAAQQAYQWLQIKAEKVVEKESPSDRQGFEPREYTERS